MSSSSFLIRSEYSSYVIMKFSSSAIQNNVMQVSTRTISYRRYLITLFWQDSISIAGFYFCDFLWANMERGIKFRDSSFLNLILAFNLLSFFKYRDKIKQAKRILTLYHNRRHNHGMERTNKTC